MDKKAVIAQAERALQRVKAQETSTLQTLAKFGKEVQDKARESFRQGIAEAEAALKKAREDN